MSMNHAIKSNNSFFKKCCFWGEIFYPPLMTFVYNPFFNYLYINKSNNISLETYPLFDAISALAKLKNEGN